MQGPFLLECIQDGHRVVIAGRRFKRGGPTAVRRQRTRRSQWCELQALREADFDQAGTE